MSERHCQSTGTGGRKCTCVIVHSWGSNGNDGKPLLLASLPLREPDIDVCKEESKGMKREEEGTGMKRVEERKGNGEGDKRGECLEECDKS